MNCWHCQKELPPKYSAMLARPIMANTTTSGFERALLHLGMAVLLFGLSLFISVVGCSFGGMISNHSL